MSRALDGGKLAPQTRVRAGLAYAYAYGDQPYGGKTAVENFENFKIRLQLVLFSAGIDFANGLGAALSLPTGRLRTSSDIKFTDDTGIGDVELRVRQDVFRLLSLSGRYLPRVSVSAGIGAPSGPYVSKLQISALQPGQKLDKNLSLGRGVWWLLGDLDVFGPIAERLGYYLALKSRTPVTQADDGFAWGKEIQASFGMSGQIVPKLLSVSVSADYLWREMPTELDWQGKRVDSASVGGKYLDTTLSLRGQVSDNIAVDVSGRKPMWRDVAGLQTPPTYWLFVGLNWNMQLGDPPKEIRPTLREAQAGDAPAAEVAKLLPAGKLAIVDYWATWCAPCLKLSKELEDYVASHPVVHVVKVDATDWDQAQMDRVLPGVAGLPVIDICGKDGRLVGRLSGSDAFDYAKYLPDDATPAAK